MLDNVEVFIHNHIEQETDLEHTEERIEMEKGITSIDSIRKLLDTFQCQEVELEMVGTNSKASKLRFDNTAYTVDTNRFLKILDTSTPPVSLENVAKLALQSPVIWYW